MEKITKTDQLILTHLEFNARITDRELAKICKKSKDTIRYRIKRLEALKIIKGYSIFIDQTKLGAMNYKLYLQAHNPQAIIAFFDKKPQVFARFTAYADWNVGVAVFCASPQEYFLLENELFTTFGKEIKNLTMTHMMSARVFTRRTYSAQTRSFDVWGDVIPNAIDTIDKQLLILLLKDGRQSVVSLAQNLHIDVNKVRRKMLHLQEKGIIAKYTTGIDNAKLGFENYKLFITVQDFTPAAENSLIETLSHIPQCSNIIRMLGPWKIEAEFCCKEYDTFNHILKQLQQHPAIGGMRHTIFRDERYFPSETV